MDRGTELWWRKSSRSSPTSDNCVELAESGNAVAVRDSKNPEQGHFTVNRDQFRALTERVKSGKLDL